jgi:hypothetical protein
MSSLGRSIAGARSLPALPWELWCRRVVPNGVRNAPVIEIKLESDIRIRIPTTTPRDLASALVRAVVTG